MNPQWRKSSYSSGNGGQCVKAGHAPARSSSATPKDRGNGPALRVTPAAWTRLTAGIKR